MQHGWVRQSERPLWEPLIDVVGLDVVGAFMWMYEVELEDGEELHAYKSIATRRYLHVALDGRAFAYVPRRRYRPVVLLDALEEVFDGWERLQPQPPKPEAVTALLARHRAQALAR